MKDRKIIYAAFAIFLLMSAAPLQAARTNSAEEAAQQHALGGGAHESANLETQGKFGVSCDTLSENFMRLRNETNAGLTSLQNGGASGFVAQASLAMKMRGMLRTARRAASKECEWMGQQDFQQQMSVIAAMSPCAPTARQMVESARDLEEEKKQEVFRQAVLVMMSPTCEVPEADEDDEDGSVEEEGDDEGDSEDDATVDDEELEAEEQEEEDEIMEEVDELADEVAEAALSNPNGASLVQEGQDPVSAVVGVAFLAIFFGIFFLLWLPFIVGAACLITGLGFLVFSLIGCMLYNLLKLIMGRTPGRCPMFNWLPHCPALFDNTIQAIWGPDAGFGGPGYGPGYGAPVTPLYGPGYVAPVGPVYGGPGYIAPIGVGVGVGVYGGVRRRRFGGSAHHRRVVRQRRIRRANRGGYRRTNRRVNRRVRRGGRGRGRR